VLFAVAVGAAAVLSRVVDDPGAASDPPSTASPGDGRDASPSSLTSTAIGAEVWFAGYEIAVHDASFDPDQDAVTVDLTMTNVQPSSTDPFNLMDDISLEWAGRRATGFCDTCSSLPPAASLNNTWTFSVDDSFALPEADLIFGQPLHHRAVVPLDGSAATGERPTTLPVSGVVDDGAGTTFTVDRVEVLPAGCSGLSSTLTYVPGPADEISVVVWGTALTTRQGSVGFGTARLVLPDGTAFASNSLNGVIYVLGQAQPEDDIPVCFTVASPTSGEHHFVVAASDVEPTGPGLAFSLDA
jgi:hypothetical protein